MYDISSLQVDLFGSKKQPLFLFHLTSMKSKLEDAVKVSASLDFKVKRGWGKEIPGPKKQMALGYGRKLGNIGWVWPCR